MGISILDIRHLRDNARDSSWGYEVVEAGRMGRRRMRREDGKMAYREAVRGAM